MSDGDYFAHVSEDGRKESVLKHLSEVAGMAAGFARGFGGFSWAYAAGMLHDIGKYSDEFQRRLAGGPKVDHATAGAYVASQMGLAPLAYCVVGHHGGLPDGGNAGDMGTTLLGRLEKADQGFIPSFEAYRGEVALPSPGPMPIAFDQTRMGDASYRKSLYFSIALFVRMVFSCLVDADYLCTERFMRGVERPELSGTSPLV